MYSTLMAIIYFWFVCSSYYFFYIFSVDQASFPPEHASFVINTESITTSGNPSKGKCMDANLEEKNKDSKVWQHGGMTATDWLTIFHNLGKLTNVRTRTKVIFYLQLYGIGKGDLWF